MQLVDNICAVCNEYFQSGDTMDPNEEEHVDFGMCSKCYREDNNVLCNIYDTIVTPLVSGLERYDKGNKIDEAYFGIPYKTENFGKYLKTTFGRGNLMVVPVEGELEKSTEPIKELFKNGFIFIK